MYLKRFIFLLLAGVALPAFAQVAPRAMTVEDLAAWQRITAKAVSDDGRWISATLEPWRGDATVYAYNNAGEVITSFAPAKKSEFALPHYLVVTLTASLEETEALKLKKTKEDKMPPDKLVIYNLAGRTQETIDSLRSYKLSESAAWIAYQRGAKTDSALYVRALDGSQEVRLNAVSQFSFAKENNILYYVTADTLAGKPGLYAWTPGKGDPAPLREGAGQFRQVTADDKGAYLAFLYCPDKDSTDTGFALYLSEQGRPARQIASRADAFLPPGWVISDNGRLRFTRNARRLFFGIAPQPQKKDTAILAENRPNVQVWNWNEPVQYTQQEYNRAEDLKKTWTVAYNTAAGQFLPLTSPDRPLLQTVEDDRVDVALLSTSVPYEIERMWEGVSRADVYTIHLATGQTTPLIQGTTARVRLSPEGKYAWWYNPQDSSWYTHSIADGKRYRLTTPATFAAWNEDHDTPSHPNAHGSAGWTAGDKALLLYDRFDIWQFDPTAATPPVNLTVTGRRDQIAYRRLQLDPDETFIDPKAPQLLAGFNHTTKGDGYYSARFTAPAPPRALLAGNFALSAPIRAKKADALLYTRETYAQYPDLHLADPAFSRPVRLTDGGRQQQPFLWGTAELTSWLSLDGRRLEGVIYKPANFDPARKYPLIVNFYERNAETLHSYRMPEPNRSTVDYHFYNSNGYIVFNPDIIYDDGYPGESCFKSVMSGVAALIAQGYIDEKAIGAQGHSWGGYQDAYLATRTNLFAAIESGAPVVNMFSAYGGIRWGSGLNRSFQYEHQQSRIGASIWEAPLRYIENSPLFDMDKVQTPILIMANDNDGHVPWYQGIEFFVALKRLQKPAWLLNYMGEPHWPLKMANKIDFQKRMFQFFEHYLRHRPAPQWMTEGVKAVDRDFILGYDTNL
jgi:dipeptidyl aminopeptidase/acylaminoacyl peptidase